MLQEFREFISRGSTVDLAVGVIIGAAFNKLVAALSTSIINPLLGIFIGQINLSAMQFQILGATFLVGDLINAIIEFLITMFVIFMIMRLMNQLRRDGSKSKFEQSQNQSPELQTLTQIRNLLQQQNDQRNRY
ncbi:large conductance mechanosensitive channel protein MscL [Lactobacillus terrae]|uniref:large conductance mechanosensitive channel protein MscL n=1 Tax=Lactobacillus terrae TaxID=2269374 RepID=UPI000C1B6E36|nr:large conductance mechanosensitive channel protein MscL [Lactobacillus terrae]